MNQAHIVSWLLMSALVFSGGCASTREVKTQKYARLRTQWTYENDFATVWKALERALKDQKIVERDPEEVSPVELKKLTERKIETDWILSKSRDKYIEFKVNGFPRKQYLQVRFKHKVTVATVIGGTAVHVETPEEIEVLKEDGTPSGWESSDAPDSSRGNGLIEKIKNEILAAPNT